MMNFKTWINPVLKFKTAYFILLVVLREAVFEKYFKKVDKDRLIGEIIKRNVRHFGNDARLVN
jgi:hypothetical protein